MNKITYCIPSKNNLRYLKNSIQSIKENSSNEYDIIVFIDGDNDGTEQWCKENSINYLLNTSNKPRGIAYAYNKCIEAAITPVVCMFHADMYMSNGFDINCLKHLREKVVVSGTRIEPPLHPAGPEKIVRNFGMYPEDFVKDEFNKFVETTKTQQADQVTYGIFAPWMCFKSELLDIGIHDESFHSYHEDSDIFNRMILNGMKCVQSRDALVYHLTCRGGQFQDGVEQITTDVEFHNMKQQSARNYLRKWGSWIKNNQFQHPIIVPKYNIAYVVKNCNYDVLVGLEPWCDRIYIDDDMQVLTSHYIDAEQLNTSYDLNKRIFRIGHNDPHGENDVVVEFDIKRMTQTDYTYLQQLPEMIKETGSPGEFELGSLKISIAHLETYEKTLVNIS